MTLEILLSTMYQNDFTILDKINLQSDAIVVNQGFNNSEFCFDYNGYNVKWINSTERGLTKSRNLALRNATADIVILADDDIQYVDGYQEKILKAYATLKDASIIAFNINSSKDITYRKHSNKIRKAPFYKNYSSVRLTFIRRIFEEYNIEFNEDFGAGSIYGSGEEAILLSQFRRKKLKVYEYPICISNVDSSESSWFNGYNDKYFYDIGALISENYRYSKYIVFMYMIIRHQKLTDMSLLSRYKNINAGYKMYRNKVGYNDYQSYNKLT